MERGTTHSEDIGFLKGITDSIEKVVVRLEKKIDRINDDHHKFHAHMSSKFDGWTAQHYQWVEERIKEKEDFANREINLLRKDIDSVKRKAGNKSAKWSVAKHAITSITTLIATLWATK